MEKYVGRARAALAPSGVLRVGLNYSNFLLVSKRAPTHVGVAPDLAHALAERLGVPVSFVGFANAGLLADAAATEAWDVAFIAAEPARAQFIAFTAAYAEIVATYLVPAGSTITTIEEVDAPGHRVVSADRAAYTLHLERTLKKAKLTAAAGGLPGVYDVFAAGGFDALAGLEARLVSDAARLPGSRVLPGKLTSIQQAIAVPRSRGAETLAFLAAFTEDSKASGLVAAAIARHNAAGLSVAPVAPPPPHL